MPVAVAALGHGDEVGAEKHAGHLVELEQPLGERRAASRIGRREIGGAGRHHRAPRRNFSVAGFGVCSVWMNIGGSAKAMRKDLSLAWDFAPANQPRIATWTVPQGVRACFGQGRKRPVMS